MAPGTNQSRATIYCSANAGKRSLACTSPTNDAIAIARMVGELIVQREVDLPGVERGVSAAGELDDQTSVVVDAVGAAVAGGP